MAKKLSMVTCLLSVVVVLALVYFFRPQTFTFLTQGFEDDFDDEIEGFEDDFDDEKVEGFEDDFDDEKVEGFEDDFDEQKDE
jgi:hypothetical protein